MMIRALPQRVRPAPNVNSAPAAVPECGRRLSSARRIVLSALYAADGPLSAEQIAGGVGGRVPLSDLASVYRNLETLEQFGIVRHVHLGHSPALYTIALEGELEFLTCERCADYMAVSTAELDAVRQTIRVKFGYVARFSHFLVVGLCAACARALGR
jgi:Fur family transcriptional regulator, ferric uptake regulator